MNRSASLTLALTLCALLLSGCGLHIRPSLGLSGINYEHPEKYTVGGAAFTGRVEAVEIHWLSGSVTVTGGAGDEIRFSETANRQLSQDLSLHYWLDGSTLCIQFCRSGSWNLNGLEKKLTLQLPERLLDTLTVDTVSARVDLEELETEELEVDTVSGSVSLCLPADADFTLDFDTVSGSFSSELACKTENGRCIFGTGRGDYSIDTTSGSVHIEKK